MTFLVLISNFKATFKPTFLLFHVFISFLLILSHVSVAEVDDVILHVGAIIDADSRIGKEQQIAMNIALQNFNKKSELHKLSLHFQNSGSDPIRSAHAAEELIKEKQVQVILGMETWEEAALVGNIGTLAQVPVLSFATAAFTPALVRLGWPFLVQMVTDDSEQINCIAAIVQSFKWQRVVAIYEEDIHGGDSGKLTLLSKALKSVGSDIDYHLILPPFSDLINPQKFVNKELSKLENTNKSRVFIFFQSSLPLTNLLFSEAKKMGFMRKDCVWIIADTTASPLIVSAMEGTALGILPYYSENSNAFREFQEQFRQNFQLDYPEEDNTEPGIHAVRAYDGIMTITQAMVKSAGKMNSSKLLDSILSSNFTGLTGDQVRFEEGRLSSSPKFRIVSIADQGYKNLGFWSSEFGFSDRPNTKIIGGNKTIGNMKELAGFVEVIWPGDPNPIMREGVILSENVMNIAVPGIVSFKEFVNTDEKKITGFCIRVYEEVQKILEVDHHIHLPSPNEFHRFYGSYDHLVESVHNSTYDVAVGDITITAERWNLVEFTEPFMETGLLMVVPVKPETWKVWLFVKPFTLKMWLATMGVFFYTMFIVWFLEQRSNPEFSGPWKEQLGNVLWFTFSTLFFAHREKIKSNYTRTVLVVWLFLVLILIQSYTASLTSMLTISQLRPTVTDIEWLKRTNAKVGCDGPTFVRNYLVDEYHFKSENIVSINSEEEYLSAFENHNISAAFLEVPIAKVFVNKHCKHYEYGNGSYTSRFGGFGFVFQKGSSLASNVSEVILKLSQNGKLKELENELFVPSPECSNSEATKDSNSLSIEVFLGLYIISAAISTVCFLLYLMNRAFRRVFPESGPTSGDQIEMI